MLDSTYFYFFIYAYIPNFRKFPYQTDRQKQNPCMFAEK